MLTTRLCSLRCNEDHLTFSVLWEMDENANILNVDFCKSVIHSKASLSYAQAQDILDSPIPSPEPTHDSLRNLNKIARILKQRRIEAGALTLASPEVRFKLDEETQNPLDVALYQMREANSMVEEWMLLANITVAKKTLQHFPTLSILRRHQPPSKDQFAPLLSAAKVAGVHLDISTSLALAKSLDAAQRVNDPFFNKLLRIMSTRCMMPAQYFCSGELSKEEWHHYGLAAPVYTHFTSPIRRYADVLVHRLLAAAIGVAPLPTANADRAKQQEQSTQMNRKHRAAQLAQRASVRLYTNIFFKDRVCEEAAHVLNISEERIDILVPRYGFEGPIYVDDVKQYFGLSEVVFRPERVSIDLVWAGSKGNRTISIFDKVKVIITTVENDNRERSLSIKLSTNV
ncbi:RNB domain-containing ribonuclease [archaeon]|nr:MAG: RNB domain-containing ribonuclease [archaeon]